MPAYEPYAEPALNRLYNLLFADEPEAFASVATGRLASLLDAAAHPASLLGLAADARLDSRLRVLAHRRLAGLGWPSRGEHQLLGVIVEVALDDGLDTLAAYADGSLRFIGHAGGATMLEPPGPLAGEVEQLLSAARPLLSVIGPWEADRLPPPPPWQARISLLVDGKLYLGQGQLEALSADPLGGPVMKAATTLLQALGGLPASSPASSVVEGDGSG